MVVTYKDKLMKSVDVTLNHNFRDDIHSLVEKDMAARIIPRQQTM